MCRLYIYSIFVVVILTFISCSSSVEETREEENTEDDSYVFDEIPEKQIDNEITKNEIYFLIQIGAFLTKQNAENFADKSRKKLNQEILVSYNNGINLFVVRLAKKFSSKNEAEEVRNELRNDEDFKDAWIVSTSK